METIPQAVLFDVSPPIAVKLNEIFSFSIRTEISQGIPLPKAKVECKPTLSFQQSDIPQSIFNGLAISKLTASSATSLQSNIEVDEERAVAYSNDNGIASFIYTVTGGLDGS